MCSDGLHRKLRIHFLLFINSRSIFSWKLLYRKAKYFEFKRYFMILFSKTELAFLQGNLHDISNSYRYKLKSILKKKLSLLQNDLSLISNSSVSDLTKISKIYEPISVDTTNTVTGDTWNSNIPTINELNSENEEEEKHCIFHSDAMKCLGMTKIVGSNPAQGFIHPPIGIKQRKIPSTNNNNNPKSLL